MDIEGVDSQTTIVAMSGGVDSSVVAALMHEAGERCVGVFMRNGVKHDTQHAGKPNKQGCCSIEDSMDAAGVAAKYSIPFYPLNFEGDFRQIIDYFVDEYKRGRTPNPCVVCNNDLKFGRLVDYANDIGAAAVATGHYAQVRQERGRWRLYRGADRNKDQTYYLFGLTQDQFARCRFPLGAMTKEEVREHARRFELRTSEKPESQEICFVPNNDYRTLLQARAPEILKTGKIVTRSGDVLGEHIGTPAYTIGQRKGLGLSGGPYYVSELRPEANEVVVGPVEELLGQEFIVERPNFIGLELREGQLFAGEGDDLEVTEGKRFRADVQIRYRHRPVPASLTLLADGSVHVELDEPESAITPGQACVFYRQNDADEECLGGGWIA